MQKHKSITAQKLIENCKDEPTIPENISEKEKNGNSDHDLMEPIRNGKTHNNNDVPPKPLPRKSISEQGSFEDNSGVVFPKPRPRMAYSNVNYKVVHFEIMHFLCVFCSRIELDIISYFVCVHFIFLVFIILVFPQYILINKTQTFHRHV